MPSNQPAPHIEVADSVRRSAVFMDTTVTIEVSRDREEAACLEAIERAFSWFGSVERACSRFDPASELRVLSASAGAPVQVTPLVYEALSFALALADETDGAFDPTVGAALEHAGFNRNFRTGLAISSPAIPQLATYRDVTLDASTRTVTLQRPLVLDLGAVAKGLAIDLAAHELASFGRFAVFAGGDLSVGHRADIRGGTPFRIGIQHPRDAHALLTVLSVREGAVCTSGDYQRVNDAGAHHILDAHSGRASEGLASVTVVADRAMLADGLSTAAFVLGPIRGRELLEANGAEGLFVAPDGECTTTAGFARYCE